MQKAPDFSEALRGISNLLEPIYFVLKSIYISTPKVRNIKITLIDKNLTVGNLTENSIKHGMKWVV